MASERTVDEIVPIAVLPQHFSAPEHSPGANDKATDTVLRSGKSDISTHFQENETAYSTEIEDDEVQFVFSVPKRRRKKRKRVESSSNSANGIQKLEGSRCPPNSISTSFPSPSQIIRRGSTGMVRMLESCHMSENVPFAMKSGSLPTIAHGLQPHQDYAQFDGTAPDHLLLQRTQHFQLPDRLSWWDFQTPYVHPSGSFQFDMCGMPFAEEILKKRKRAEEHDGQGSEKVVPPSQQSPNKRAAAHFCRIPAYESCSLGGLHGLNSDTRTGAKFDITSRDSQSSTTSRQAYPTRPLNSFLRSQKLTTLPRRAVTIDQEDYQVPQQQIPRQTLSPVKRSFGNWTPQQFIQVPVSLIPELSVSPRTKTVQVVRQADLGRLQRHETPSQPFTAAKTTPLIQLCEQSMTHLQGQSDNFNGYSSGHNTLVQTESRFPPSETAARDILRKPSLYKIPPWPSSPVSLHMLQNLCDKDLSVDNKLTQRLPTLSHLPDARNVVRSNVNITSALGLQHEQKSYTAHKGAAAAYINSQEQDSRSISSKVAPQPSCRTWQASHGPNTLLNSSPGSAHTSQPTRKHSPNLIVDIAETCQESFPFAAVAERHKQPIQKVFDAFSAIIQLPLLRSVADNRRHGDVAKTRMKEFRDAKKAMDKAQELERKKALKKTNKPEIGDAVMQRKPKKAPELLKAAILNNVRIKED